MNLCYKCECCQNYFIDPLIKNGMFVCPSCKKPEFETISSKTILATH